MYKLRDYTFSTTHLKSKHIVEAIHYIADVAITYIVFRVCGNINDLLPQHHPQDGPTAEQPTTQQHRDGPVSSNSQQLPSLLSVR